MIGLIFGETNFPIQILKKIKNICKIGTSADKQIKIFKEEMKKSNNKKLALDKVLKFLVNETMNF